MSEANYFTKEQRAEIVDSFRSGISVDHLAIIHGCDEGEIESAIREVLIHFISTRAKDLLNPVSSTLDRLLDSRFDMSMEAWTDLGEIEHKGEKVMVKIKVVRGE